CTRGWAGRRPCWCWGPSSPPHCSPPRWPSPPAAPRPAPGRWEGGAPRPPSHSMLRSAAEADALRAEMTGAAAKLARPSGAPAARGAGGVQDRCLPGWPCRVSADRGGWCVAPPVTVPRPAPAPFGLDCGRHCLDALIPPPAGAFVVALAARRSWFCYHRLFTAAVPTVGAVKPPAISVGQPPPGRPGRGDLHPTLRLHEPRAARARLRIMRTILRRH